MTYLSSSIILMRCTLRNFGAHTIVFVLHYISGQVFRSLRVYRKRSVVVAAVVREVFLASGRLTRSWLVGVLRLFMRRGLVAFFFFCCGRSTVALSKILFLQLSRIQYTWNHLLKYSSNYNRFGENIECRFYVFREIY